MSEIITVGFNLAKNVFQVHGADGTGQMERGSLFCARSCGTGAVTSPKPITRVL